MFMTFGVVTVFTVPVVLGMGPIVPLGASQGESGGLETQPAAGVLSVEWGWHGAAYIKGVRCDGDVKGVKGVKDGLSSLCVMCTADMFRRLVGS